MIDCKSIIKLSGKSFLCGSFFMFGMAFAFYSCEVLYRFITYGKPIDIDNCNLKMYIKSPEGYREFNAKLNDVKEKE